MTLTNLIDMARQYAQSEEGQLAAMDALLAGHTPQTFTPPPEPPAPQHLVVEYHHEAGYDTRDILATTLTRTDEEVI